MCKKRLFTIKTQLKSQLISQMTSFFRFFHFSIIESLFNVNNILCKRLLGNFLVSHSINLFSYSFVSVDDDKKKFKVKMNKNKNKVENYCEKKIKRDCP